MVASGCRDLMRALNEVEGMVQKAARGAGFPQGQAEDLGRVAAYLAGTSGDVQSITDALQETLTEVEVLWSAQSVTVKSGPAIFVAPIVRDAMQVGHGTVTLAQIAHAPLVSAFLAADGIAQAWNGCDVSRSDTTVLQATCGAVTVPEADWNAWSALAARTYVPETATSRLAGAGAGLTDND